MAAKQHGIDQFVKGTFPDQWQSYWDETFDHSNLGCDDEAE
jgi:hypothetical protein